MIVLALATASEAQAGCVGVDLAISDVRAYRAATDSVADWGTPGGLTLGEVEIVVSYKAQSVPNDTRYFIDYYEGLALAPALGDLGMQAAIRVGSGGIHPTAFHYGLFSNSPWGAWVDIVIDTEDTVAECDETNNIFSVFVPIETACESLPNPSWVCLNGPTF